MPEFPQYKAVYKVGAAPVAFVTDGTVHVTIGETVHGIKVPEGVITPAGPKVGDFLIYEEGGFFCWYGAENFEKDFVRL